MPATTPPQAHARHRARHASHPGSSNRRDEGAVSIFIVAVIPALVIAIGLGFDLAARVHTLQRAHAVAAEAARAGGEQLQAGPAVRGEQTRVDATKAATAARDWLSESGVTGTVQVRRGTTVEVTVTDVYRPRFLSIIGITGLQVEAHASARVVRAVDGAER